MIKYFSSSEFDFSGKRVRFNGKCQSKFDLSYLIGLLKPLSCYSIYPDAYPYADYVSELKSLLGYGNQDLQIYAALQR